MTHKQWVDNEYQQWIKALQESTVDNFGDHPMVKRMLGQMGVGKTIQFMRQVDEKIFFKIFDLIDIGCDFNDYEGNFIRMAYYAEKVLRNNPTSIVEIGGGVGQFYAVLRALGYKGKYFIYDLPEVKEFQRKYLDRVTELTGLNTDLEFTNFDYCVSFYALGELDDETKEWYVESVVKQTPHGMIVWNPHSNASKEINFPCKIEPEYPLTHPDNKFCVW